MSFYERAILVWIKFKLLHENRINNTAKSQQFALIKEFSQFLAGFIQQTEQPWAHQIKSDQMLSQAVEFIASIIL